MSKSILKKGRLPLLLTAALGGLALSASANAITTTTYLSYSAWSDSYGYISFQTSSPYLPQNNGFSTQVASDYKYDNSLSSAAWTLPANESTTDFFYNAVTDSGKYGYSFSGQAQALGNQLKASVSTTSSDINGASTNNTSIGGYAYASYSDKWLIGADAKHVAGSYGAIVVTAQMDGSFPTSSAAAYNSASAYLSANTSFKDLAGVTYNSQFNISADPMGSWDTNGSYTAADWSTTQTVAVTKKLLFQYGTAFDLSMYLQTHANANGEASFFNTAKITDVLLPFGAMLETGSLQAAVAGVSFGNLHNAATLDDANTNWDFGSAGGGAIIPVPEPESYAMLMAGLGLMAFVARRRKKA